VRVEPMKAVLTDDRFSDPDWIYERKLDGIRCIGIKTDAGVRLWSRNHLSLDDRFPEVVEALGRDSGEFVVDGEVVAFAGAQTSFAPLQQRGERHVRVFYYVFDLLHAAGQDTTALRLRTRKTLLRRALVFCGPIRLTNHRNRDGEALYHDACRKGWEGVIAKRLQDCSSSAAAIVGKRSLSDRSLRESSRTGPPSRIAMQRMPSSLRS
jgi:bifunctional non-homologous end joining protein LigD